MDKSITRMQAIVGFVLILLSIFGAWGSISSRYTQDGRDYENHESRIKRLEDDKKEVKEYIQKVENKVDAAMNQSNERFNEIGKQNTQILILLQNKADRK